MRRQTRWLVWGGSKQGGDIPQFDDAVMSGGAQAARGLIQVHLHHTMLHVVEGGQGFSPAIRYKLVIRISCGTNNHDTENIQIKFILTSANGSTSKKILINIKWLQP